MNQLRQPFSELSPEVYKGWYRPASRWRKASWATPW